MPGNSLACALPLLTKLLKTSLFYSPLTGALICWIYRWLFCARYHKNCNITSGNGSIVFLSGVCIAPWKSVSFPTQKLKFLGFNLDSQPIVVILTPERAAVIKQAAKGLVANPTPTVWELAEVISKFVVAFQGCVYGPSHYHQLGNDKINALKTAHGDYDCYLTWKLPAPLQNCP